MLMITARLVRASSKSCLWITTVCVRHSRSRA